MTRILVIEDDLAIRDLLGQVLIEEGYELLFAAHLDGAAPDATPDLIVTDLVGLRAYESGRARASVDRVQQRYPGTPIIVCTGHEQAMEESDRLGATEVLRKPFTIDALVQTVARVAAR